MGITELIALLPITAVFVFSLNDVEKFKEAIKKLLVVSILLCFVVAVVSFLTNGYWGVDWNYHGIDDGYIYIPFDFGSYYCWWILALALVGFALSAFAYIYLKKSFKMYEIKNENNKDGFTDQLTMELDRLNKLRSENIFEEDEYVLLRKSVIEKYSKN